MNDLTLVVLGNNMIFNGNVPFDIKLFDGGDLF